MEELIVTKEELKVMFIKKKIIDTNEGWFVDGKEIEILAIHDHEPKYVQDLARAERYRLRLKENFT